MRDARHHPDVDAALPWLAVVATSGLFATSVMPRDGWLSIAPVVAVVVTSLVVGVALLVRAGVRGAPRGILVAAGAGAIGAGAIAVAIAFGAILGLALVLAMPVLVAVGVAVALVLTGRGVPPFAPAQPAAVGAGAATSLALVALGVVDGLVWLPETLVPGLAASEVHAALDAAGEGGAGFVVAFGALWGASTLVVAGAALWGRARPGAALAWTLVPGILAIVGLPWWEFAIGMGIADSLETSGGMSWAMPWLVALACSVSGLAVHGALRSRAAADAERVAA